MSQIDIEGVGFIPYSDLTPTDWGDVYEKYVGQIYQQEGFDVEFRGLTLGFNDRGVDLVAVSENDFFCIQCKYSQQTLTKQRIEWILYKASKYLHDLDVAGRSVHFVLVIRSISINFSKLRQSPVKSRFISPAKNIYPMLDYFLSHNERQNKIRLSVRELEMPK